MKYFRQLPYAPVKLGAVEWLKAASVRAVLTSSGEVGDGYHFHATPSRPEQLRLKRSS
eukprot:SAG31_NODE_15281_length_762_cov_1.550528_1_plen_57_part_10